MLIKDTKKQRFLRENNVTFITIEEINEDIKLNEKRRKLGLPPTYQHHIDKFSFKHNFNKDTRYFD